MNAGLPKSEDKPNLPKVLFWEYDLDNVNWKTFDKVVIDRAAEYGNDADWAEVIRFYGYEYVKNDLLNEISYLPNFVIKKMCDYFSLNPDHLYCVYARPAWRGPNNWK